MSCWLTDPDLFLYAIGTGSDDVHLWRCKKPASSSSRVVPLKPDDFDYVETVTDYMELLANTIDWDETNYKRLVKYIFERHLLVNGQGFVIAELRHKVVDQRDGNKMIDDDANEEVPAIIYIRSLDVLALKSYIPNLRERTIPLRTVQVLEDVNGKAAVMEEDSKVTARFDNLEGKVTKLTADLATALNTLGTLQRELRENPNIKEVWMNDLTHTEWVGIEKLRADELPQDKMTIIKVKGTFTTDDNSNNVRARYCCTIKVHGNTNEYKAFSIEDLTPHKEKARFLPSWWRIESQGKAYIITRN